jgi:hypothetical protein
LTTEFGGNVHEKGVVNITASGDNGNKPWQVADHGSSSCWMSKNEANSWICFEFKRHSISLKNYTLKSRSCDPGFVHPREWVVEGSNDGSGWELLDSRNTEDLNGLSIVKTFNCSTAKSSDFFRFIRLRQTGVNCGAGSTYGSSSWRHYFTFTAAEFFGTLHDCV